MNINNRNNIHQRNMHNQKLNSFNNHVRSNRENQNKKFDDLFRDDDNFVVDDEYSDDRRYVKHLSLINRKLNHGRTYLEDSGSDSCCEANWEQIEKEENYTARIGEAEDYIEEQREKVIKNK